MWGKDFKRTLDYLTGRNDLDQSKIGYFGWSWGAIVGAIIPAIDERIKVVIVTGGGLTLQVPLPEVDQLNYLPRINQPFLSLNGKYDHFFPLESSQKPMLDLLGTPSEYKKYLSYETTHQVPRNELIKESLDWLDKYFGNPTIIK